MATALNKVHKILRLAMPIREGPNGLRRMTPSTRSSAMSRPRALSKSSNKKSDLKTLVWNRPNIQGLPSDVDTSYDRVHMKGLAKWDGEAGAPLLPVKPLRILVPYNHRVIKVKVFKGHHETIEGEFLVEPAQEPIPMSQSDKAKLTPPNPDIYESDRGYPLVPCGDALIQKMHGYTVLTLNLFPVEYHPKSKKISYYPQMRIQVSTHPLNEFDNDPWVDQAYANEVRALVENPDASGYVF